MGDGPRGEKAAGDHDTMLKVKDNAFLRASRQLTTSPDTINSTIDFLVDY